MSYKDLLNFPYSLCHLLKEKEEKEECYDTQSKRHFVLFKMSKIGADLNMFEEYGLD